MMSLRVSTVAVIQKNSYICGRIWFKWGSGVVQKSPNELFFKRASIVLEKKAQTKSSNTGNVMGIHQFDVQTCDPNTWIKIISGTSSWKQEQFTSRVWRTQICNTEWYEALKEHVPHMDYKHYNTMHALITSHHIPCLIQPLQSLLLLICMQLLILVLNLVWPQLHRRVLWLENISYTGLRPGV